MSVSEEEWQKEQRRVDRVVDKINDTIDSLKKQAGHRRSEILDIRKDFWDDVTVNLDEPHEAVETATSIRQQAEVLSERERSHRHTQSRLETLKKLRNSPYFGRIDFREEGEPEAERIYLGIASHFDEESEQFLVYDWRAPVSSLYYDFSPGPAEYRTPAGTVSGEMELKRQYLIREGRILSLFDTGVTIGDDLLKEILGKQANTRMKSIVATIQREQNQIIRNVDNRLLVVQGVAGSGKTSAALQRVAYLLYRYRETLNAEQIVLFSPNPMFNRYVATVLPELGEENIQQTTFQEYLEHRLARNFRLEDPFTQLEYTLTADEKPDCPARMEAIQYKGSFDFMHLLDQYVEFLGREDLLFRDLSFRGQTIFSAKEIRDRFYSFDPALSIPDRMQRLRDWLLEELKKRKRREQTRPWVEKEVQLLDHGDYERVHRKLQHQKRFTEDTFDDFHREQQMLAEIVVQRRFKPLRKKIKQLHFVDLPGTYRQLFDRTGFLTSGDLPAHWAEISARTVEKLDRSELAYEDATPYLYLKDRIEGTRVNTSVRHVLIDEAQDYTPFQFAFLKRLFPRAKMTALGDLNQSIFAHALTGDGFNPLAVLYGEAETRVFRLTRSYRSTRPIVEFTRPMIRGGETIEPFNREGAKPTVTKAADSKDLALRVADRARALQGDGHRTIAVICKTDRESREAHEALKDRLPHRLIGKETASFEEGILVLPSYLAKGVEFDAVILYNASREQYGKERERKLFYTACTRAMHELHVYYTGEKSPFLSDIPPEHYILEE
ncbi:DNA helicase-2/ATP-dependent DNA helicase PcrA [Melghirimyces profundicolus]|uniref:DNA helicase-2/ATP-dependent DNA helicase PcrA n=1 Tax=Melghirimyces profundicolus TaxID=1242148 RepID=A0A2T6C9J0_9BACL|nr:RNA polymerase recycling motor HelD [Melghirimyces profundicolus]PTX64972.1 DNA helicase-2/ATP-dependent DNA helicase PcrA [Melghirimyces profundicolus]